MYLSFKKKLGFIHIPKNGGTTMSKLFYNNLSIGDYLIGGYKSEINLTFFEKKFKISKHTSLKQLSDLGYLKDDLNNFSWFALIREPISRVKSVCTKLSVNSDVTSSSTPGKHANVPPAPNASEPK